MQWDRSAHGTSSETIQEKHLTVCRCHCLLKLDREPEISLAHVPRFEFQCRVLELFYVGHRDDRMAALKHLLRYVAVTKGFGLKYKRAEGAFCLMGYNDSDLTGDMDDRRSTTRVLFFLGKYGVLAITEAEGRD
jgi:hypothetical protein